MSDGNKRYLGDVFIQEENYERQKKFFKDVIESYQWKYNGNFDASTLQGKTPDDFATKTQGENADKALLAPLFLGKSPIGSTTNRQYIYTDAVLLERDDDSEIDSVEWYKNLDKDNLTEALVDICRQVTAKYNELESEIEGKLDSSIYENFQNDFNSLKNTIENFTETFEDEDGNEVTKIDADLTNGLRFRLITQEAYDDLSDEEKNYWRNIFIIRDPQDIPPDYVDPMTWDLSDGYTFIIEDGYLKVNNGLSDQWKVVCSTEEFLESANFDNKMKDFIEDNDEYVINTSSLSESIKNISSVTVDDNYTDYPFLSSELRDSYITKVTLNDSSSNVTESYSNGLKIVDIDFATALDENTSSIKSDIQRHENEISALKSNDTQISGRISSIVLVNDVQQEQINEVRTDYDRYVSTNDSMIKSLMAKINQLEKDVGTWTIIQESDKVTCYANKALKMGYIQALVTIGYDTSSFKVIEYIPAIPEQYRPKHTTPISSNVPYSNGINIEIGGRNNSTASFRGRLLFRCNMKASASNPVTVLASGFFYYGV